MGPRASGWRCPTRLLIHQPTSGFQGQSSDIEIHAREILELRRRAEEIYSRHTGKSIAELHDDMERDRFFDPEEGVAYGLIDRVIERHELPDRPRGFASAGVG